MSAGEVLIQSGGGSSNSVGSSTESFKGIKAVNDIEISGGTVEINSADDCIHANSNVIISGGSITGSSDDDGIHADTDMTISDSSSVTVTKSYEGLEATNINLKDGIISVKASDDGINAAGGNNSSSTGSNRPGQGSFSGSTGSINVSGGNLYVNASGDGIDANGTINVSGGEIVVSCPTTGDTLIIDFDSTATITAGSFVGTGSSNMAQNFSGATQGPMAVKVGNQSAGTEIIVRDSNGDVLINRIADQNYNYIIVSCMGLSQGSSYTVTAGNYSGSVTCGANNSGNTGGNMRPAGR